MYILLPTVPIILHRNDSIIPEPRLEHEIYFRIPPSFRMTYLHVVSCAAPAATCIPTDVYFLASYIDREHEQQLWMANWVPENKPPPP
jgi:hypothetical protein